MFVVVVVVVRLWVWNNVGVALFTTPYVARALAPSTPLFTSQHEALQHSEMDARRRYRGQGIPSLSGLFTKDRRETRDDEQVQSYHSPRPSPSPSGGSKGKVIRDLAPAGLSLSPLQGSEGGSAYRMASRRRSRRAGAGAGAKARRDVRAGTACSDPARRRELLSPLPTASLHMGAYSHRRICCFPPPFPFAFPPCLARVSLARRLDARCTTTVG